MAVYLVTWNINKERANYAQARQAFIKNLDRYESISDQGLESVRFISSSKNAGKIYEDLFKALNNNDRIFVTKLTEGNFNGWCDEAVATWLNTRT